MEIIGTPPFLRSAKPLAKKYRSFESDYHALLKELKKNPTQGDDLGNGFRKVRMAIASKGKGKSGGCRVITLNTLQYGDYLFLLFIYDKSSYDNISISVIKEIVAELDLPCPLGSRGSDL